MTYARATSEAWQRTVGAKFKLQTRGCRIDRPGAMAQGTLKLNKFKPEKAQRKGPAAKKASKRNGGGHSGQEEEAGEDAVAERPRARHRAQDAGKDGGEPRRQSNGREHWRAEAGVGDAAGVGKG